jgi:hypothetical protein
MQLYARRQAFGRERKSAPVNNHSISELAGFEYPKQAQSVRFLRFDLRSVPGNPAMVSSRTLRWGAPPALQARNRVSISPRNRHLLPARLHRGPLRHRRLRAAIAHSVRVFVYGLARARGVQLRKPVN